jgi:cytochrome oxidase Cu insertion factor (SCO1/SenC/PrrC family)/thiol-disulfide isomerase/thioredoxin
VTLGRLRWISLVGTLALLCILSVLSVLAVTHARRAPGTSRVPAPLAAGTALERPRPIPATELLGASGRPVAPTAWRGKWVVLAPFMTLCHEVCPMTTAALIQLKAEIRRQGLGGAVIVAEATVDPWRDTPSRLRAYRRLTGADVELLTGTRSEIHRLWKFLGVFYKRVPQGNPPDMDWLTHRPERFDVQHTDGFFILDPAGQERLADEGMPKVSGRLPIALRGLLNKRGRHNLANPQLPWSAPELLDDLDNLMGREITARASPAPTAPTPAAARRALLASPHALAAIHDQSSRLLGDTDVLMARLRSLRGYPVVLNAWASWCGPCRGESPLFATASATYGRQVAFLGVNTNDTAGSARAFLARHPVSYPSYQSSSGGLSQLAALQGLPTTIFINRAGRVVDVHAGQYDTQGTLDNDIERYALSR